VRAGLAGDNPNAWYHPPDTEIAGKAGSHKDHENNG
jgi:hypothetical protein